MDKDIEVLAKRNIAGEDARISRETQAEISRSEEGDLKGERIC